MIWCLMCIVLRSSFSSFFRSQTLDLGLVLPLFFCLLVVLFYKDVFTLTVWKCAFSVFLFWVKGIVRVTAWTDQEEYILSINNMDLFYFWQWYKNNVWMHYWLSGLFWMIPCFFWHGAEFSSCLCIIRVRNMNLWVIIAFCDPYNTLISYLNKRTTGALKSDSVIKHISKRTGSFVHCYIPVHSLIFQTQHWLLLIEICSKRLMMEDPSQQQKWTEV